jgi:hypothetical protein
MERDIGCLMETLCEFCESRFCEGIGEDISVMERDIGCSMETLYEFCESRLCEGIGEDISGSKGTTGG